MHGPKLTERRHGIVDIDKRKHEPDPDPQPGAHVLACPVAGTERDDLEGQVLRTERGIIILVL